MTTLGHGEVSNFPKVRASVREKCAVVQDYSWSKRGAPGPVLVLGRQPGAKLSTGCHVKGMEH